MNIELIPAKATINSQDIDYVNHNCHKLSLFKKKETKNWLHFGHNDSP